MARRVATRTSGKIAVELAACTTATSPRAFTLIAGKKEDSVVLAAAMLPLIVSAGDAVEVAGQPFRLIWYQRASARVLPETV